MELWNKIKNHRCILKNQTIHSGRGIPAQDTSASTQLLYSPLFQEIQLNNDCTVILMNDTK